MKQPQLLAALLLCLVVPTLAHSQDRHVRGDDAQCLYRRSAFAHGYIHGYEQGFHAANLDWHMGRTRADVSKEFKVTKREKKHMAYEDQYGDRGLFTKGFERGYTAAYSDVYGGKAFSAVAEARAASEGLTMLPQAPSPAFDEGFQAGVNAALQGDVQTMSFFDLREARRNCSEQSPKAGGEYCDAYARGFAFIAAHVARHTNTETAKAQAPR